MPALYDCGLVVRFTLYCSDVVSFLYMKGIYPRKDLTGQRFGKLTVLSLLDKRHNNHRVYLCQCDCGKQVEAIHSSLNNKHRSSCGCLAKPLRGLSKTHFYKKWVNMHRRCYQPHNAQYHRYGARGVRVCDKWHAFLSFYEDMSPSYFPGATLDRKENDGDYSPQNCQWATPFTQANNRRNNIRLTLNGRTQTISQWSRETGLHKTCIRRRLLAGWTVKGALTIPAVTDPARCTRPEGWDQ